MTDAACAAVWTIQTALMETIEEPAPSVAHLDGMQGLEEFDALEKGFWNELPQGGHVWRLRIHSPGASSHTLVFR